MLDIREQSGDHVVLDARGKLTSADYDRVLPRLEETIEREGRVRLLIRLEDFRGWTLQALMDDLRFDVLHRKDFAKMAVVGETFWERLVTRLSAPLFGGEVRFFEDEPEAEAWLQGPPAPPRSAGIGGLPAARERAEQDKLPPRTTARGETDPVIEPRPGTRPTPREPEPKPHRDRDTTQQ